MEHALGVSPFSLVRTTQPVLILIVMEHALGEGNTNIISMPVGGLNPYCNGTCSRRCQKLTWQMKNFGLNPYCNGTCSRRLLEESGINNARS